MKINYCEQKLICPQISQIKLNESNYLLLYKLQNDIPNNIP